MTNTNANKIEVDWTDLEKEFSGLSTGQDHVIEVKREAIPLIFVPGIMGSMLRLAGTDGKGKGRNSLPNTRWNPTSKWFMLRHYLWRSPSKRRRLLLGDNFDEDYLEVHNSDPVGNGYQGVFKDSYHGYLDYLQQKGRFGPLDKIFDFPVYGFGYNWTASNVNSGEKLAARIDEIIEEAKTVTGKCEKVILITHSMGGLVSRQASEEAGANSKILGIIHGVQPAAGAATAYWRIKAGLGGGIISQFIGNSGRAITPILGNMPGGLELLPNKNYLGKNNCKDWLRINDKIPLTLPKADPYKEIYQIPATGNEIKNPGRKVWGLVDPDLLDPDKKNIGTNEAELLVSGFSDSPWDLYCNYLKNAESFHDTLNDKKHPDTYTYHGLGEDTSENIEMDVDVIRRARGNPYPSKDFRGIFKGTDGKIRRTELQKPDGEGDGTVSVFSATFLDEDIGKPTPLGIESDHEGSYKKEAAKEFSVKAITALCKKHYEMKTGK